MTKEEAKQKLRKSGYNVVEDNSVVTVYISPEKSMKNAIKDVKEKLYSWGYNASFGIKQHKGAEEIIDDLESEELEETNEEIVEEALDAKEVKVEKEKATKASIRLDDIKDDEPAINKEAPKKDNKKAEDTSSDDEEWFDEEDSDMLLTEDSIQFSLEDFGLDF